MIATSVAALASNALSHELQSRVSKMQAIIQAEKFIRDNGYTSAPPDKSELSYELFDGLFEKNIDLILSRRRNTLHAKAFCLSEDEDVWHVGFLSSTIKMASLSASERQSDLPGRAVVVRKDGLGIKMAHKDPAFSYFKKL
jgi:hypothetical protein